MTAYAPIVQRVARSVVGLRAGRTLGCAFAAMGNGVLVTSQQVVGFEREVLLLLDEERTVPAVVLRVNVALDVALILPNEPIGLLPLDSVQEPPGVGAQCAVVGKVGQSPIAVVTHVAAVDRQVGGHAHLEIVTSVEPLLQGAPLIDSEGFVRGVVTRARSRGRRVILPTYAYEGGLESVNRPADELRDIAPEYGCPRCDTIFEPAHDRCLECGTSLPHAAAPPAPRSEPPAVALGAIRVLIGALGAAAGRHRVDARTWSFVFAPPEGDACEMQLSLDADGRDIALKVPLVRVVTEGHEFFYRFLLTLNDDTLGVYKASVDGECAFLEAVVPLTLAATRGPQIASELVAAARHYRGVLERSFGAEPAFESDDGA
jgi:hypothetical protein